MEHNKYEMSPGFGIKWTPQERNLLIDCINAVYSGDIEWWGDYLGKEFWKAVFSEFHKSPYKRTLGAIRAQYQWMVRFGLTKDIIDKYKYKFEDNYNRVDLTDRSHVRVIIGKTTSLEIIIE